MAKRLEENLYRSAQTKEEYLDPSTLKRRLQLIAHRLEGHGSSTDGSKKESSKRIDSVVERNGDLPENGLGGVSGLSTGFTAEGDSTSQQQLRLQEQVNQLKQMQQLQQLQQLQQQQQQQHQFGASPGNNLESLINQQQLKDEILRQQSHQQSNMTVSSVTPLGGGQDLPSNSSDLFSMAQHEQKMLKFQSLSTQGAQNKTSQGILKTSSSKYDPQKRKVVKQQQQRLLLLRHASKCGEGASCKVKFCGQMISLWKHMKKCRDKDCKTAHCLSSRCVLNHYRICKSKNNTSSCEVCGPVMRQIKDNHPPVDDEPAAIERDDTVTHEGLSRQESHGQQQPQAEREGGNPSSLARVTSNSKQIEELAASQQKFQQKQALLIQLQNQQMQLFEQQRQLEQQQQHVLPQSQEGQHFQQQQLLLQQLLIQFQQQEMLLRQEIMQLSQTNQGSGAHDIPQNLRGTPDFFGSQPMFGALDLQGSDSQQLTSLSDVIGIDSSGSGQGNSEQERGKHMPANRRGGVTHKASELQGSTDSMSVKGIESPVIRRGSMGKRLSALESRISRTSDRGSAPTSGIVGSIDASDSFDVDPSSYRSASQGTAFVGLHNSTDVGEGTAENEGAAVPGEALGDGKYERVLEQGDTGCTMSLITSMSKSDIVDHLRSLEDTAESKSRAITQKMLPVVRRLFNDPLSWVFRDPVDVDLLGIPDYYDVVKNPMHLTLVEQKLESGVYQDMKSAEDDVRLVFENGILYNGADSEVGEMATKMIHRFESELHSFCGKKMVTSNVMLAFSTMITDSRASIQFATQELKCLKI